MPEYLARQANRKRHRHRPTEPTSLDFELDENHLPPELHCADVRVHDQCHLIFATSKQLHQLTKAKTWYVDGTFKLCQHPFSQLLTINAFVRKDNFVKQVHLLFIVMPGRKKLDYRKVIYSMCVSVQWQRLCGLSKHVLHMQNHVKASSAHAQLDLSQNLKPHQKSSTIMNIPQNSP